MGPNKKKDDIVRITPKSRVDEVQNAMDKKVGKSHWGGGQRMNWQNLLSARNHFIKVRMRSANLSALKLDQLAIEPRRNQINLLANDFKANFFQYTRDGSWMQHAAGDNPDWIAIEGMAFWQVQRCLLSIVKDEVAAVAPSAERENQPENPVVPVYYPYDPVRDI